MRRIGIDFGTCNIKGAERKKNGNINYIKLGKKIDEPTIPNVILYEKKGESYTTLIGYSTLKPTASEQDKIRHIKSHLQEKNWTRTLSFGKVVSAYDVTLDIMKCLYEGIYSANKDEEILATITVPVNFSKRQQVIVEKAAIEAGFKVDTIITEPFAALFFLMQDYLEEEEDHKILIFDFGGGTLDLCLAEIKHIKKGTVIETQSTIGITYGGNNLNQDIIEHILKVKAPEKIKKLLEEQKNEIRKMANQYFLLQGIEEMKAELFDDNEISESKATDILITSVEGDAIDFGEISVRDIYTMLDKQNWRGRIYKLLDKLFEDSNFIPEDITDIFIVGGTGSIPYFRKILEGYFIKNKNTNMDSIFELNDDIDIEDRVCTSVAAGAAIYKEFLEDDRIIVKDKIPFMIYVKDENGKQCAKLTKNDYFKDYASSLSPITKKMKEDRYISIYQTIFGEEDKEVFLGNIELDEEILSCATLYRLTVDKKRTIQMELGYLLEDDDLDIEDSFCIDWQIELKIEL